MKSISRVALGSLCAAAAGAGALVLPAVSQAAKPGDLCRVDGNFTIFGSQGPYSVGFNETVRIVDYAGPNNYLGHTAGHSDGTFYRYHVNQSTCH